MPPVWLISSVLLVTVVVRSACWSLPPELEDYCRLEGNHLQCLHLNTSHWAQLSLLPENVGQIAVAAGVGKKRPRECGGADYVLVLVLYCLQYTYK